MGVIPFDELVEITDAVDELGYETEAADIELYDGEIVARLDIIIEQESTGDRYRVD